ncbi:uncharacterized protein LOC128191438 [Crassostrea angulata]|uniref:uncharacterized protein LOC128191438 n=1 Tax=Magallana angulata TaxID=2784310 RepID=UPI0022B0EF13|nr:uncharacterized protein LOC128191438 [Crassostrea angulata]
MMKSLISTVLLLLLRYSYVQALAVKVLKPPTTKQGVEGALLIAPGAYIKGEAYESLGLQIGETCNFRLWVVLLLDFFDDIVNPPQLQEAVTKARNSLKEEGFQNDGPVFLAGHSLGGTMVSMYGQKSHGLSGVLLYAAYLTKGHKLKDYPVPVMTLSGDLDGLTRITRVMVTFNELYNDVVTDPRAKYHTPVILMEGVNHGQFASGRMPSNVATHDLSPDVTNTTAYQRIANYTCSFVSYTLRNNTSSQWVLDEGFNKTYQLIQPLRQMKELDTNRFSTSNWTQTAQKSVIALQNASQILVKGVEIDGKVIKFSSLSPKTEVLNSTLYVTTYSEVTYPLDPFDVTLNPLSAVQIQAKMISQERAKGLFPQGLYRRGNFSCKYVNELSVLEAFYNSSSVARERYARKGRQLILEEDMLTSNELAWLVSQLELVELSDGLHVQSQRYETTYKPSQKDSSGLFYCSLLSPFRAMEWIYVDSLRPMKRQNKPKA